MYILIKLLLTIAVISVLNQTAYAEQLDREALRENIIKRLPKLNHTKFQVLMKRVGKEAPKGYFQCFCSSYSIMGNGIGYSPNRDKHCDNTDPCKGGNWGCSSYPLPSDSKVIERCIKSAKYDDNTTIVDAIEQALNKIDNDKVPKIPDLSIHSLLKDLFKKSCLPIPKEIDNLNPDAEKLDDIFDITKRNHIRAQTKSDALREILYNAVNIDNICEASMETKLSIESIRGKGFAGTFGSFLWTVYGIDEFTLGDMWSEGTGKIASANPFNTLTDDAIKKISGMATSSAQAIKILQVYSWYENIKNLYNEEKNIRQQNADLKDALTLFRKSRTWSLERLKKSIYNFEGSEKRLNNAIQGIKRYRDKQLSQQQLTEKEKQECFYADAYANDPDKQFSHKQKCNQAHEYYNNQKKAINKIAEKKINERKLTIISNNIKLSILKNYRKPLIEKSCNEYIDDRLKNCSVNIGRDKPLNHKDINKLWEATKKAIKMKIKVQEEELKHQDEIDTEELRQAPLRRIQK